MGDHHRIFGWNQKAGCGGAGESSEDGGQWTFTARPPPTSRARWRGTRKGCGNKDAMMHARDLVTPSPCRPTRVSIASPRWRMLPGEGLARLMPARGLPRLLLRATLMEIRCNRPGGDASTYWVPTSTFPPIRHLPGGGAEARLHVTRYDLLLLFIIVFTFQLNSGILRTG